jgi:hypothetical protein
VGFELLVFETNGVLAGFLQERDGIRTGKLMLPAFAIAPQVEEERFVSVVRGGARNCGGVAGRRC